MATPGPKKKLNLNTAPIIMGKKRHNTVFEFHFRSDRKIVGKAEDMKKCKICHRILPSLAFTTQTIRVDGAYYLRNKCRECHIIISKEQRASKRKAPPIPNRCNCCHIEGKKLQVDHLHGSNTFRGWLCRNCNSGIGFMGDNLEGVLQAAIYLENDTDKIIETLHEVYKEMFARTK